MKSYIILAIKVDGTLEEALDQTHAIIIAIKQEILLDKETVTVLNTIPAPD